ncbi:MAG TPA: carbohydrate porin [Terriglobales bacterium]|nr:carbohydrate porin [Terriglobales bacterium]
MNFLKPALRSVLRAFAGVVCASVLAIFFVQVALAQASPPQPPESSEPTEAPKAENASLTMFEHPASWPFWISGQANIIYQTHGSFPARYSGPNSFSNRYEWAISSLETLYTAWAPTKRTELLFNLEETTGGGLSDAVGLAGFTDLDVVRNPELGPKPYVARVELHHIFPLSSKTTEGERGPLDILTELPQRRVEVRAGKFSMVDFFDQNDPGSDSHYQFMNWTIDNNGAYDYAADTRGYTYGIEVEYQDRAWALRFAETVMPKVANGLDQQWNLRRARAENIELELRPKLLRNRSTRVRLLSYVNHANMGVYRTAIDNFLAGKTPVPEITAHPLQTTIKYGFGANVQQDITSSLRAFARFGWNEGQHESFAYTEVDQTVEVGGDLRGNAWKRKNDKAGVAFVSNAISKVHQEYLALGGRGFLLGDGALNYGRENILEAYYNAHVWKGLFAGPDVQHIANPGYNRDRGPVLVPGLRVHLEF